MQLKLYQNKEEEEDGLMWSVNKSGSSLFSIIDSGLGLHYQLFSFSNFFIYSVKVALRRSSLQLLVPLESFLDFTEFKISIPFKFFC